jgi:hypothetical protein
MIMDSYMLRQDITSIKSVPHPQTTPRRLPARKALVTNITFKTPQAIVTFLVSLQMLRSLEASGAL